MVQEPVSPIFITLEMKCHALEAFDTYTGRIAEWWDPKYTPDANSFDSVTIEPGVGGRVYSSHRDFEDFEWGVVTVWKPGSALAHTFSLAQDPRHPTEIAVEFVEQLDRDQAPLPGCTMRFEHRGWTAANAAARGRFSDWEWEHILTRFTALADASP
jgi:hypothetical protein